MNKRYNCSWPFIRHSKWTLPPNLLNARFDFTSDAESFSQFNILSWIFFGLFGLMIVMLHLVGRYNTRRKYYEPLAREVSAYSATMGSTEKKTALDRAVFNSQESTELAVSIMLAMVDPLSLSYSFDVALHDYGRMTLMTIVMVTMTRGLYFMVAYHVFTYCSRENFSCLADLLYRRFNSHRLASISSTLMLALEFCQVVLLYNQMARELSNIVGYSFQFWIFSLSFGTFFMALCGFGSLVKFSALIYLACIFTYYWMALLMRFTFSSEIQDRSFAAWILKAYETQQNMARSTTDNLLYEGNLVCALIAAPLLHTAARLNQTEYNIYQSLNRRYRRRRVFFRAFLINLFFSLCHKSVLRSLFALHTKTGCDHVSAGLQCHYSILSDALMSHSSLCALYVSLMFYRACWLGSVKVLASAHSATKSRIMSSFVELCLIGKRWTMMNRWRKQNGLILFRGCQLIDLQSYVYKTFIVLFVSCALLCCLDYLPSDPSALKVQFINYLILDLKFIVFLNSVLLGLAFRRLSRTGIYWIVTISLLIYAYQLLWGDRITYDLLSFKLMTPLAKSHAAWLRRNCSKRIRLRPVINVGKRTSDHEIIHLVDSDAFYPTVLGLTWCLASIAGCLFTSQLAVLKSPYYCIGDSLSASIARSIQSGLVDRARQLISAAWASLQSVRCSRKHECHQFPFPSCASCLCSQCCGIGSAASASVTEQQRLSLKLQQQPLVQNEDLTTMSIAAQLVRDKYAIEETELILSTLADAGLRQRLIDSDRRQSEHSVISEQ